MNETRVPAWAKNGTIRYARWDGGIMEATKAHLSNWEYLTSPQAFQSLIEWYGEKSLSLIKEAGFNWIWVTWSCGFSYKSEELQHQQLRPFISRCKEEGIHVTAYLSLCNIFLSDVQRQQPELLETCQRDLKGNMIPYAGAKVIDQPERVLGSLHDPRWIEHLKNRLRSAIESGADAAFYDNMAPWDQSPAAQTAFGKFTQKLTGSPLSMPRQNYLTSPLFQELASVVSDDTPVEEWRLLQMFYAQTLKDIGSELSTYAQQIKPDFMVYFNWHVYHYTFGDDRLNALSTEDGLPVCYVTPGTVFKNIVAFEYKGYVCNLGLYRRLLATAEETRPVRVQSHQTVDNPMEGRNFQLYSGSDWRRMIAEAWCFRAAQEIFLEGNFQTQLFGDEPTARESWRAISEYNKFHAQHESLWGEAKQPVTAFAVVVLDNWPTISPDYQKTRSLTALALEGFQFSVVLSDKLRNPKSITHDTLWGLDLERLSDDELEGLDLFLQSGGTICITGKFAEFKSAGMPRTKSDREGWVRRLSGSGNDRFLLASDSPKTLETLIESIPAPVIRSQDAFQIKVTCSEGIVIHTVWAIPGKKRLIFLLNPDNRGPRCNVKIHVQNCGSASWHAAPSESQTAFVTHNGLQLQVDIPKLDIFGYLLLDCPNEPQ